MLLTQTIAKKLVTSCYYYKARTENTTIVVCQQLKKNKSS